jgi:hypothetical protein
MMGEFVEISIPAGLLGGVITLLIREVGARIFSHKPSNGNGNGNVKKEELSKYLLSADHRLLCHEKSDETNKLIQRLFDNVKETNSKVDDLAGFVRGKMG